MWIYTQLYTNRGKNGKMMQQSKKGITELIYENEYSELRGRKLLILGGTHASLDAVRVAQSMGVHVTVTDEAPRSERVAKQVADAVAQISTGDISGLTELITREGIDGVFCGPSEFNIKNMIRLCAVAGLPCYATEELWNRCADKTLVKRYCEGNGVKMPEEYPLSLFTEEGADGVVKYPVAVKPVDGCSSKGVTVCYCRSEVLTAVEKAKSLSVVGRAFVERYIDNGGRLFNVRYLLCDGEAYPYLAIDTFISDPVERKRLISALSRYPSILEAEYMRTADGAVRKMLRDMGLRNGTVFLQMLPLDGEFYCMDMGFRLSGGLFYKLTEPMMGISDMKMMIRYALGGKMCTEAELGRIRSRRSLCFAQLTTPIEAGRIARIDGGDAVRADEAVIDCLQYYKEGDTVSESVIGTLGQHLFRISMITDTEAELHEAITRVQDCIRVTDTKGAEMYRNRFDPSRM